MALSINFEFAIKLFQILACKYKLCSIFYLKNKNIIKKGVNIKDTLNLYAACLVVSYTQRPSGFKAIIKSIFKTNLPSLTSPPFF